MGSEAAVYSTTKGRSLFGEGDKKAGLLPACFSRIFAPAGGFAYCSAC
jgi:hypothetical protein